MNAPKPPQLQRRLFAAEFSKVAVQTEPDFLSPGFFTVQNGTRLIEGNGVVVVETPHRPVTPREIGVPYKVGNCEVQWLYNQPASWVGEAFFRAGIKIEKNPSEVNCPDIKARSMSVDIPIS